jgi:MFS family permease
MLAAAFGWHGYCDLPRQFGADRRDGTGRGLLRGAAMGLHSMAGYAGGFLGPLGVGLVLDLAGGEGMIGWGLAFGHRANVTLAGLVVLRSFGAERQATPRPKTRPVHPHVDFSSGFAYWRNRTPGVECPRAGRAALSTIVGILAEVPVMPSVVHLGRRGRAWYQPA